MQWPIIEFGQYTQTRPIVGQDYVRPAWAIATAMPLTEPNRLQPFPLYIYRVK